MERSMLSTLFRRDQKGSENIPGVPAGLKPSGLFKIVRNVL